MNIELLQTKMVSGDPDLSFEIGENARQWAAKVSDSNMLMFEVIERMRFFYPTSPHFRGCVNDLKFLTYPGEGYVPNLPGSIFDTPSTFKLGIYLDMTPYIWYPGHSGFEDNGAAEIILRECKRRKVYTDHPDDRRASGLAIIDCSHTSFASGRGNSTKYCGQCEGLDIS